MCMNYYTCAHILKQHGCCVNMCVCVQMSDLQPFKFDLRWCPCLSVSDDHVQETRQGEIRHKNKLPALNSSICCRADWSVMRREERICSRTGGEQKVKAEGRTGWRERNKERGEGGGLLLPLHNEWGEKSHICCGCFMRFMLLNVRAPELTTFIHMN